MSASPTADGILRRLEWTVIRRLDGLLHGDYRTLFRGYGLDLADLREYQYGDDVRHIDWNVTARLQTPYVREFNEEREVAAWFLLDMSPSVDFGSEKVKKRAVSTEFVTVLARILTRHGNRVGAVLYGTDVDTVITPKSGRRHVLSMLHRMITRPELPAAAATDLNVLLHAAHETIRRRSDGGNGRDIFDRALQIRRHALDLRESEVGEVQLAARGIEGEPQQGDAAEVALGDDFPVRRVAQQLVGVGPDEVERSHVDVAVRRVGCDALRETDARGQRRELLRGVARQYELIRGLGGRRGRHARERHARGKQAFW